MPKTYHPPEHLRDVPTPLNAGEGAAWMPCGAIHAHARRNGVPLDAPAVRAACAESVERWRAYREALRAADTLHHGTPPTGRRRSDACAHAYNRARLAAWMAALPGEGDDDGRHQYALAIAASTLDLRLAKRTRSALTSDLLPDLPRRCDLTDAADDVTRDLRDNLAPWSSLRRRLQDAADVCLDEALGEMGWQD